MGVRNPSLNSFLPSLHPDSGSSLSGGGAVLTASDTYTCVVMAASGEVRCWGDNKDGQLGLGTSTHASPPVTVVDG